MRAYIISRLLRGIPILIAASMVIFALVRVLPGDVALRMVTGGEGEVGLVGKVEELEQVRRRLGLDRPLYEQYLLWMGQVLQGDFGISYWTQRSVTQDILQALPITVEIAILAILISLLIAIPVGIIAAVRQDSWQDYLGRLFSIGFLSIPEFWTATLFILFALLLFKWIPPVRYTALWEHPQNHLAQMLPAAIILGIDQSAAVARMLRSSLLEVLRQDYIRTAWAKGLRERTILLRHALKNAFIPVMTLIGLRLGRLMGGTVVLERIFGIPGIGNMVITSITDKDYPVLQVLVLFFAAIYVVVNLAVDITYAWMDPRIRYA